MFYLYVLKSNKDGQWYIGSTRNLKRRFSEHTKGEVYATKNRRPLELFYYEAYAEEALARNREKSLKLRGKTFSQLKKRLTG